MHPKACPLCGAREERLGRGFEHVSMRIEASGVTLFVRCRRCQRVFAWPYDERQPPPNGKVTPRGPTRGN